MGRAMATAITRSGLHCTVVATPETLKGLSNQVAGRRAVPQPLRPLRYGESIEWRGAELSAYPASHILGAAQLLIEYGGERIVYTGDIKLREPICGVDTRNRPLRSSHH